jgi:hypothetical protein
MKVNISKKMLKAYRWFDLHDWVVMPLVKSFPRAFGWLKGDGWYGYAPWYIISRPWKLIEYGWRDIKYAYQRVVYGYDSPATFDTHSYLAKLIPAVLRDLKKWGNSCPTYWPNINPHLLAAEESGEPISREVEDQELKSSLAQWHTTLDEMIEGFEAAGRLIHDISPPQEEFYQEWERLHGQDDWWYLDYENATECGVEWKTYPEYDEMMKAMRVREREEEWRKEELKKFHRGMLLFHRWFFDLWD